MPATALAFLAIAAMFSVTSAALLIRSSIRSRTSDGLSTVMLALNLLVFPFWIAYGLANHNWLQAATSVLWLVVQMLWWGFWLTDRGKPFWPAAVALTAWTGIVVTAAFTVVPFAVFGWIAGVVGTASSVPQLIALLRADHVGNGFDVKAWTVSLGSLTAWTLYALFAWDLPVLVPDLVAVAITFAIVTRAWWLSRVTQHVTLTPTAAEPDVDVIEEELQAMLYRESAREASDFPTEELPAIRG